MNSEITFIDQLIILYHTFPKVVRGLTKKIFFKSAEGLIFIGKKTDITHYSHIMCGKNVKFEDYAEIHGLCKQGLVFGNNVTIGRSVKIRPSSYYGKDLGQGLTVDENSSIGPESYIGCSGKIEIGKNVMIGPKCSLFAENHNFADRNSTIKSQGVNQKGIVIEDDCWIGSNCIILDGVTIGRGSVIGAGTLITKDVPKNSIIIDCRNKKIKSR